MTVMKKKQPQNRPKGVFPVGGHDHGKCLARALDHAEEVCRGRGARLTDSRRRVLELIWRSHAPIGAYEVLDGLRRDQPNAQPPTVYRAIDFLARQGLVHRIESRNAFVGCCSPETGQSPDSHGHGGQFLICRACGAAAEMNDPRIEAAILSSARDAGFTVGRGTIEVEGLCPNCTGGNGANGGKEP